MGYNAIEVIWIFYNCLFVLGATIIFIKKEKEIKYLKIEFCTKLGGAITF